MLNILQVGDQIVKLCVIVNFTGIGLSYIGDLVFVQ